MDSFLYDLSGIARGDPDHQTMHLFPDYHRTSYLHYNTRTSTRSVQRIAWTWIPWLILLSLKRCLFNTSLASKCVTKASPKIVSMDYKKGVSVTTKCHLLPRWSANLALQGQQCFITLTTALWKMSCKSTYCPFPTSSMRRSYNSEVSSSSAMFLTNVRMIRFTKQTFENQINTWDESMHWTSPN